MPLPSRALTQHEFGSTVSGLAKDTPSLRDERLDPKKSRPKTLTEGADAGADDDSLPARQLTRALALQTSEKDRKKLYVERSNLVTKEFLHGLDAEETGRLGSITWILEQMEDAELGPALDTLEQVAALIEAHGRDLARFASEARGAGNKQHARFFPPATVKKT